MAVRTARKGRNTGGQFWGCTRFPACRTILEIEPDNSGFNSGINQNRVTELPVAWIEAVDRNDYDYEYLSVGSLPGSVRQHLNSDSRVLRRLLSQTLILRSKRRASHESSSHARLVADLFAKLLQRGHSPLPTLGVERAALKVNDLLGIANDLEGIDGGAEVGWELPRNKMPEAILDQIVAKSAARNPFILDSEYSDSDMDGILGSPQEFRFLNNWIPLNLGAEAGHWVTPQASLDTLLEANGGVRSGFRRVDFLVSHPYDRPFVVEIDGPEHEDSIELDANRDDELQRVGIEVIRITNAEVIAGKGPGLDRIKERWNTALSRPNTARVQSPIAQMILDCAYASKLQIVIARAMSQGLLAGNEWTINVSGGDEVSVAAVMDALDLLVNYDTLYGGKSAPDCCTIVLDQGGSTAWQPVADDREFPDDAQVHESTISVLIERESSPFHTLPGANEYDFIIRPAYLPVDLALQGSPSPSRRLVQDLSPAMAERALTTFLHALFRKRSFRPQQASAVYRTMRQQDLLVLLPTGFGKSLIYQLAGLLMPGITLVVDPLVALIEDQVEGLHVHGIERTVGISGASGDSRDRERLTNQISRGAYFFVLVAPERLQIPEFRDELDRVRRSSLINLAVIDEAHCVSEWGHDFRPSYLKLADNLRRFGADSSGTAPPVLGLTGTASRAVLKDIMADSGIGQSDSSALIRPDSFDRPELTFSIQRVRTIQEAESALKMQIRNMPAVVYPAQRMPTERFYTPQGRDTHSGIIFTRAKTGRTGVDRVAKVVQEELGVRPGTYAGDPTEQQRADARNFKANLLPILVATKAFGMGIDKPNIRWIIHFGMPGSLESYYQEAGRAGRDQHGASCVIAYTEFDRNRSDSLLDQNSALEELRTRFEAAETQQSMRDDITSALYFHNESFPDQDAAIKEVEKVLRRIPYLDALQRVEIPWRDRDERPRLEHAIIRLQRIGVIRDYAVEFGRKFFDVETALVSLDESKALLMDYISLAQPQLTVAFRQKLGHVVQATPLENALELSKLLIDFTYEVVERARRRAIWEAISLARSAQDDSEFRRRLLDYLQGGIGLESIDDLLSAQTIELDQWWSLLEEVQTPLDAGELRGICARALESYPEHPGLLFIRGAVEAMCSDYDWRASTDNLIAAFRQGQRLLVPNQSLMKMANNLYDLADSGRATAIALSLTYALTLGLGATAANNADESLFADLARIRGGQFAECGSILAVHKLVKASHTATMPVDQVGDDFTGQSVRDLLEVSV